MCIYIEQGRVVFFFKKKTLLTSYTRDRIDETKSRTPSREDKEEKEEEEKKRNVQKERNSNRIFHPRFAKHWKSLFEDLWIRLDATHLPFPPVDRAMLENNGLEAVARSPYITLMLSLRCLIDHVDPPTLRSIR